MDDILTPPNFLHLRTTLQDMVRRDLLGPAGSPEEIITERNVCGRDIFGLLVPQGQIALLDWLIRKAK